MMMRGGRGRSRGRVPHRKPRGEPETWRHPQRRSCEHMAAGDILVPAVRACILAVRAHWLGWFPWRGVWLALRQCGLRLSSGPTPVLLRLNEFSYIIGLKLALLWSELLT